MDNDGERPIHRASTCGHLEIVDELINERCIIDSVDKMSRTPLYLACCEGHFPIVSLLLKSGQIDLDQNEDEFGNTALHGASIGGYREIAKLLLEQEPTLINRINDARRGKGRTALQLAVLHCNVGVVEMLLLNPHIDLERKDSQGRTAYALLRNEIIPDENVDQKIKNQLVALLRDSAKQG